MNEFNNYLLNNKEWIFSGIGIFILGGICTFFKFQYSKNQKKKSPKSMSQINNNTTSSIQIGQQNNYYAEEKNDE